LSADSDAFQHSIASELFQDEVRIDFAGLLLVVGNDATDEVRAGASQSLHQLGQLLFVHLKFMGYSLFCNYF